jgi:hypothetical protein
MERARAIAARYARLPGVVAVALSGSRTAAAADAASDLDLYVYADPEPEVAARAAAVTAGARRVELGNAAFEPGDEWIEPDGLAVDVMFRTPAWLEEQLDRVLRRHQASVGYTTCIWHNLLSSEPLVDVSGWLAAARRACDVPYPEPLRAAIVARNHPLLRASISSFLHQLERALARGDAVAANHRSAALLASFFDVLLALNRLPHPGEKRLVRFAEARCALRPPRLGERIGAFLARWDPEPAGALLDDLDALLAGAGLLEAR